MKQSISRVLDIFIYATSVVAVLFTFGFLILLIMGSINFTETNGIYGILFAIVISIYVAGRYLKDRFEGNNLIEKRQIAGTEKEMAEEQRFVDYEVYSNDEYGFSMYYPKGLNLDISHPRPGDIDLFVTFRGIGFEGVSLTIGPIGFTKFGVAKEELEFRGKEGLKEESPAQYGQTLISSRFITVDGIEAYEQIYTAISFNSIRCKIKQVGFFKNQYEYVLTFMAPLNKFNDIKSLFDKCIKSFKFK